MYDTHPWFKYSHVAIAAITLNLQQPIIRAKVIAVTMAVCEKPLNDQGYIYKVGTTKNEKIVIKESE